MYKQVQMKRWSHNGYKKQTEFDTFIAHDNFSDIILYFECRGLNNKTISCLFCWFTKPHSFKTDRLTNIYMK